MIIIRRTTGGFLVRVHPQVPPVFTAYRETAIVIAERLWWTFS